jgi:uracil permease
VLLAFITFAGAVVSAVFLRGVLKMVPVLMGVTVGYLSALVMGQVDTTPITQAAWFGIPHFTWGSWDSSAVALIAPVALVTVMEHVGDIMANGRVVGKDFFSNPGLQRTLLGDGIATLLSGFWGGPTLTTYAENTGVLAITGVYNPAILRIAAVFAIALSLSPKIAGLFHTLPNGVLGGIAILLFGMIASIGVRTLSESEIDFAHSRNLIIVSAILVLGLGGAVLKLGHMPIGKNHFPLEINGMALAAAVGVLMNALLPRGSRSKVHAKS